MSKTPWFSNHGQKIQVAASVVGACAALGLVGFLKAPPEWLIYLLIFFAGACSGYLIRSVIVHVMHAKAIKNADAQTAAPLTLQDLFLDDATGRPELKYPKKLRIIVTNEGQSTVLMGPGTTWTARGNYLKARRQDKYYWEAENGPGWREDKWTGQERTEIYLQAGESARTWIGLDLSVTEDDVRRFYIQGTIGTLSVPLQIDGKRITQIISL